MDATRMSPSGFLNLPPRPAWSTHSEGEDLHHVEYEFEMLDFTAHWLQAAEICPPADHARQMKNAMLESFAAHVQNIIGFLDLAHLREQASDIKARYFVADVQKWTAERDCIAFDYSAVTTRANRRIAHLTTGRLDSRGKGWDLAVVLPLRQQEHAFHANLKPEYRSGRPHQHPTLFRALVVSAQASTSAALGVTVSSAALKCP